MTTNRHQLTKTSCCIALYLCATTLVAVLCLAAAVATMLGAAEKHYIAQGIQQNIRLDGRTCSDFRPIELQLGVVEQASGSARLRMGATDVIVGVKVEIGSPDPGAPNRGKLQVSVECSPVASPEYQGRGGEEWGAEMAHAVQAALLGGGGGGGGVDLSSLCILAGKTCWLVYVDALVLNNDGNVLSAVSLAAHAALVDTRVPRVEVVADEEGGGPPEIELDDGASCGLALDASRLPVVVTVSQVGSATVLDMDGAEEGCAEASAHIAVNARGEVCGLTQDGPRGVHPAMLQAMVEAGQRSGPAVLKKLAAFLHKRWDHGASGGGGGAAAAIAAR